MKLILLLSLFAFSTVFLIVNSFSQARNNLFPAAAIFLIMGGFLLAGPGLQIQEGTDLSYTTVNNSTVVDQKTPTYETVQGPLPDIHFSNILGMLFMVMGAGYIVMASPGRFISFLRN
jgi:hypothetical protein